MISIRLLAAAWLMSLLAMLPTLDAQNSNAQDIEVSLESLGWLEGHWMTEGNGRLSEEIWTSPRGTMMLGMNRTVADSGKTAFEYVRIEQTDDGLTYFASPSGKPAVGFRLKDLQSNKVIFENVQHDFPQRIIYRLEDGELIARIEGEIDGQAQSSEWRWSQANDRPQSGNIDSRMLLGLRTAVYKVDDIKEGKQWYSQMFDIEPYFDEPFYVGFNIGGYELGLDPDMKSVNRGNNQPVYWGVVDCRKAFESLITKGAKPGSEPEEVGGGIVVATIIDPFGNTIGIIENPHFKIESAR